MSEAEVVQVEEINEEENVIEVAEEKPKPAAAKEEEEEEEDEEEAEEDEHSTTIDVIKQFGELKINPEDNLLECFPEKPYEYSPEELQQIWNFYDQDKSGYLDVPEMKKLCRDLCLTAYERGPSWEVRTEG
eukprot:TRINITY_DN3948_c1_g1_i1.p1 TRINITY_DN3948_c1_g1~~TRINITY_DN3948_c1_g1_i1.p1  ORF type:complete len:131 (-),score=55.22 TRINITY_DN3948_c1_g1_i1:166-558(-)